MELNHEFTVAAPISRAWAVLTNIEEIAPCMPGAELTEVDGDTYHGLVKIRVGPITAQYQGTALLTEKDESAHRVVMKASGRDARGQGNAAALVTATMTEQGDGTLVSIITDLTVSGRVAQFGRGVMHDVSAKLLQQFVDNLEADVLGQPIGGAGGAVTAAPAAAAAGAGTAGGGSGDGGGSGGGTGAARENEPVRVVGIVIKSMFGRLGHAIARLFRRSPDS
jgi:carbon monoxide dehydrogenase subunit G